MCECECLCLFICVGPAMGRWPVQGVFLLAALMHAGINIIAPKWKKKKKKMVGNRRAFDAEVRWWRLHSSNSVLYVKLWIRCTLSRRKIPFVVSFPSRKAPWKESGTSLSDGRKTCESNFFQPPTPKQTKCIFGGDEDTRLQFHFTCTD